MELLKILPSIDASKHLPKTVENIGDIKLRPIRKMEMPKPKKIELKKNLLFSSRVKTPPTYGWTRPPITTKSFEQKVPLAYRG